MSTYTHLNKWSIPAILAFLLLCGGILRFHALGSQSYWMDEGYTINATLSVIEKGTTVLDSGHVYSCSTYCYPTALIAKTFGETAWSYRLLAATAGLLFILAIFFITAKIFNRRVALLTSFFVTFSYWQVAWSRQARWYTLFALFFWIALYFFYQSLYSPHKSTKNKVLNISLTLFFTVLACVTHGLGYLLPLIFVGWIIFDRLFIVKKYTWKLGTVTIVGVGALLAVVGFKFGFHYVLPYYLNFYLRTYWFFILFSLVALFTAKTNKREMYFILFVIVAYLLPLSFATNIVHYRYLFQATPVFFMLAAVGMLTAHDHIKIMYGKVILWCAIAALFFTVAGGVLIPRSDYYLESDNPATLGTRPFYSYTPQPDWNSAYEFIAQELKPDDIVISTMPQFNKIFLHQPGYWIKYNYLGFTTEPDIITNDKEFYVDATVVDDLPEFKELVARHHGYLVMDYMALDGKVPVEVSSYIVETLKLVYHEKTNEFSEVWVYAF